MYKILYFIFLSSVVNNFAKDALISSFPRSGSTWFAGLISQSNNSLIYEGKDFKSIFLKQEVMNGFKLIRADQFSYFYQKNWISSKNNFGKAVLFFRQIPELYSYFDIVFLYRHRKYTFPAQYNSWFLKQYHDFITTDYEDPVLEKLKKYAVKNSTNVIEQQCIAHIVAWYCGLKSAQKYNLPIIEYEKLMCLKDKDLDQYLKNTLPKLLYSKDISVLVEKTRNSWKDHGELTLWEYVKYFFKNLFFDYDWINCRESSYKELNVEPFCQKFITYLKECDPEFNLWYYFQ